MRGHPPEGHNILRYAPEMKYAVIKNHNAEFSVGCFRFVRTWHLHLHQMNHQQQCRSPMMWRSVKPLRKQNSGMVCHALQMSNRIIVLKHSLPACVQYSQLPHLCPAGIGESAETGFIPQRTEPEIRNETSRTCVLMRADCTWRWPSTCGPEQLSGGQCHHE